MTWTLLFAIIFLSAATGKSSRVKVQRWVRPCNAEWCDPSHEPYPNIVAVMTGYNLLRGNPFPSGDMYDPGFSTSYIFNPTYRTPQGGYALHQGISVRKTMQCTLQLDTTFITTMDSYSDSIMTKSSIGVDFASNLETEVSAEVEGVGISTTVPPLLTAAFGSSREAKEGESYFTKKQGIMTMNEATCNSYAVHMSAYNPPPFSQAMENALRRLHHALEGSSEHQEREVIKFIEEFGTHFQEEVIMGARLSMNRKYSLEEFRSSSVSKITECNQKSFSALIFGMQIGAATKSCEAVSHSANSLTIEGYDRVQLTSYGSKPFDSMTEWSQQTFTAPLPIKMKLSPILNLFTWDHMKRFPVLRKSFKAILRMMAPIYYRYCGDNRNTIGTCSIREMKGCGWNDQCTRKFEACINKPASDKGYSCCKLTCPTHPCKNGGTCANIESTCSYSCSCPYEYEGRHCEMHVTRKEVIKDNLLKQMKYKKSRSHAQFAQEMVNYYESRYPLYYFTVVSYKPVTGYQYHTVSGKSRSCVWVFRMYKRNVVVGWALRTSRIPALPIRKEIESSVKQIDGRNGCNAEKNHDFARQKLSRFNWPIVFLLACEKGKCDGHEASNGRYNYINVQCYRRCYGLICIKRYISFFYMFGKT